ncbi:MAG: hypothetical protein HC934_02995 [Acaryochloridaceae cyanobacterium SU_2_1]|nr:hypothetical protein [Acaryochloridaceae cyanobacterium SU_2_1]
MGDLESEIKELRAEVDRLSCILEKQMNSESAAADLPSQAKNAIALHRLLRSRPFIYLLMLLAGFAWGLPVFLQHVIEAATKINAITALLPREAPSAPLKNPQELLAQLRAIKAHSGADLAYFGEYYADREQGAIRLEIDKQLWLSIEPKPPVLLPLRDAFEANALGDCQTSRHRTLAQLGIASQIACPIARGNRLFVVVVGFLGVPPAGALDQIKAVGEKFSP